MTHADVELTLVFCESLLGVIWKFGQKQISNYGLGLNRNQASVCNLSNKNDKSQMELIMKKI